MEFTTNSPIDANEQNAEVEITEELITPQKTGRPWKYVPEFTDEDCRLVCVEKTEDDVILDYRHHTDLGADNPSEFSDDVDVNGELEFVELAQQLFSGRPHGGVSGEEEIEVAEELIVPVRIERRVDLTVCPNDDDDDINSSSRPLQRMEPADHQWTGNDVYATPPVGFQEEPSLTAIEEDFIQQTIMPQKSLEGILFSPPIEFEFGAVGDGSREAAEEGVICAEVQPSLSSQPLSTFIVDQSDGAIGSDLSLRLEEPKSHGAIGEGRSLVIIEEHGRPESVEIHSESVVHEDIIVPQKAVPQKHGFSRFVVEDQRIPSENTESQFIKISEKEEEEANKNKKDDVETSDTLVLADKEFPLEASSTIIVLPDVTVTAPCSRVSADTLTMKSSDKKPVAARSNTLPPKSVLQEEKTLSSGPKRSKSQRLFGFFKKKPSKGKDEREAKEGEGEMKPEVKDQEKKKSSQDVADDAKETKDGKQSSSFFRKLGFGRSSAKDPPKQQKKQMKKDGEEEKDNSAEQTNKPKDRRGLSKSLPRKTNFRIFEILAKNKESGEQNKSTSKANEGEIKKEEQKGTAEKERVTAAIETKTSLQPATEKEPLLTVTLSETKSESTLTKPETVWPDGEKSDFSIRVPAEAEISKDRNVSLLESIDTALLIKEESNKEPVEGVSLVLRSDDTLNSYTVDTTVSGEELFIKEEEDTEKHESFDQKAENRLITMHPLESSSHPIVESTDKREFDEIKTSDKEVGNVSNKVNSMPSDSQFITPVSNENCLHLDDQYIISLSHEDPTKFTAPAAADCAAVASQTNRNYMVAVAIDFGTAFSGYAFCFLRDPNSIHMMGRWEDGDPGVVNQKTPTCLLVTPDGEFHSFGYTARNNYHDLTNEETKEFFYFDRFKMALYEAKECNQQTKIEAANGKRFSGLKAISMTLRFFRDHALQQLSQESATQIHNEDVLWIVTVPAIWNASAKQFMRMAAYQAELASSAKPDQLLVALEPEAASIQICRLQLCRLVPEKPIVRPLSIKTEKIDPLSLQYVSTQFNNVIRYMVVDCGGGTVDITVHEMNTTNRRLKELHSATGGPHGSFAIDHDFEKLLCDIFDRDFVESYRLDKPSGWIWLMTAFESRKRATDPRKINSLNIALPFSFIEHHKRNKKMTVEEAIKGYGDKGVRWSSQGMLRLSPEVMINLFQPTLNHIKQAIYHVLIIVKEIEYIFLVGGLSDSPVLQCDIRQHFGQIVKKVIVPQEANLTVIKGAVSFGIDPSVITVRRSKLTYGASVLHRFIRGKHPESKLVVREGVEWCKDVFDVFVGADQVIRSGDVVIRQYIPATPSQKRITVDIYCTERHDPQFISDSDVKKCANICLDLSAEDARILSGSTGRRRIQTQFLFSDTEIKVTALDGTTGKRVDASIDFLNI